MNISFPTEKLKKLLTETARTHKTKNVKTETLKTIQCDYESRRRPKTNRACVLCQKDITGAPKRMIHIIAGGAQILHPESEKDYTSDGGDMLFHEIGNSCAKKIGLEWTHAPSK